MPLFNKLLLGNYAEFHEIKKKTYFHIMLNNCIEFPSSLKHTVGEWIFSIKFVYIVLSKYNISGELIWKQQDCAYWNVLHA